MTITPDQARRLLDGTTPAPWVITEWENVNGIAADTNGYDCEQENLRLAEQAPNLAHQIAGMTWEYAVQYQNLDGKWKWSCKEWDNRWQNSYTVQEIRAGRDHQGVETRIVRRLVTTPEAIE